VSVVVWAAVSDVGMLRWQVQVRQWRDGPLKAYQKEMQELAPLASEVGYDVQVREPHAGYVPAL
jgi:hypothetical protein